MVGGDAARDGEVAADDEVYYQEVDLVVTGTSPLLMGYEREEIITLPIAHGEGNYFA